MEIARRDLEWSTTTATTTADGSSKNGGVRLFQYSSLSSEIVEVERKPKPKTNVKGRGGGGEGGAVLPEGECDDDDDEGAFQTMGASDPASASAAAGRADEGGMKKRAVPILTVYLATRPVKALRSEFGWVFLNLSSFFVSLFSPLYFSLPLSLSLYMCILCFCGVFANFRVGSRLLSVEVLGGSEASALACRAWNSVPRERTRQLLSLEGSSLSRYPEQRWI